jgi:hypothetical protein
MTELRVRFLITASGLLVATWLPDGIQPGGAMSLRMSGLARRPQ